MDNDNIGKPAEQEQDEKQVISPVTSPTITLESSSSFSKFVKSSSVDIEKQTQSSEPVQSRWKSLGAQIPTLWPWAQDDDPRFSPIVRKLKECPHGYPRLAAYLDSDQNFTVFRRFGYIQSRLLLEKQDELRKLEKELQIQDQELSDEHQGYVQTRVHTAEIALRRQKLMQRLEKGFCEYSQLMIAARDMVALNQPAEKDYRSVLNWVCCTRPQSREEGKWIRCREDLVTLRPGREHAWLDSTIEHVLKWLHCSIVERLFCSKETRQKADGLEEKDGRIVYYTPERIDGLVIGIIVAILIALLIIPIYLLYHFVAQIGIQRTDAICIGILLVFTLAFSAILSLFTRAKRHEILAAAAGYCAVLVVFLGNVNFPNP